VAPINSIEFGIITKNLVKPYKLSFTTVTSISSFWVCTADNNGKFGLGEAVPLPGYGSETLETMYQFVKGIIPKLIGLSKKEIILKLLPYFPDNAFAASAIATATEFPEWTDKICKLNSIPLVYSVSASTSRLNMAEQITNGLKKGYKHFKMKIGRNLKADLISGQFVLKEFDGLDCTFRFDANQAYTLKKAEKFCRSLEQANSGAALWLEQPMNRNAWKDTEVLCGKTSIPVMLDESIYNDADIRRAKNIGCSAVKLKLFKHPGISECLRLASIAKKWGLNVTMGNGVSSDIGNLCEALVISEAPNLFVSGSECNGFAKLKEKVAFDQLSLNSGKLIWEKGNDISFDKIIASLKNQSVNHFF
jgi:L-alanine-DL-glutamate epimerase-like enolase superfamily enzyme